MRASSRSSSNRVRDHALGEQRAVGEQGDQAPARAGLFLEQGGLGRTPDHAVQQTQQAIQTDIGADAARGASSIGVGSSALRRA